MAEFSKDYSKDIAFVGDYPEGNTESGNKKIKVGSTLHMYDSAIEDNTSALPKSDIIALIDADAEYGLTQSLAFVTSVTVIDGAVKKKTRTITVVKGRITAISVESNWS